MPEITIERKNGMMKVKTPYHPDLPKKCRNINGDWSRPYWFFDLREEQGVLALLDEVYGFTEAGQDDLVDVTVKVADGKHLQEFNGALYLGGRELARATSKLSGADTADGISIVSGEFDSGGSHKNWKTMTTEGAEFIIRDMYRVAAERLQAWGQDEEQIASITINEITIVSKSKLEAEIATLEARLKVLREALEQAA